MFQKLVSFTKKVADLSDQPSGTPAEIKAQFDAAPDEVRQYLNSLIDALKSSAIDDSGAKNIGATSIAGVTGSDVQTILESLKTLVDKKLEGTGKIQTGRTVTLTVPAGQTYGYGFNFTTPFTTKPKVVATPEGSIANCSNLVHSITDITTTGFKLEIKNKASFDEFAFYNWTAVN